ncbi:MAG: hypothetical protein U9P71_01215 [Campylobacterota bacterium]|nr:hypothetical protein [Campylobacterota bacterium]
MNEMYAMSIDIHDVGVLLLVGIILMNMVHVKRAKELRRYAKQMRIMMPFSSSMIFLILFTGMVMMAAKHLSFTIENIVMILFAIAMIIFEAKRYGSLKHINFRAEGAFETYKGVAIKILLIELAMNSVISIWMLM